MNATDWIAAMTGTCLIECIDVWHVDAAGCSLRRHQQVRLSDRCLASHGDDVRIREGEGPAGMAWHQKRAVILHEEPSALLTRIGAQQGLELAALVAYPVIRGQTVLSVVVFGIGNGPGAFEVWSRDDRDELSVCAGYYSRLRTFEYISRHVRFPKGAGLPGIVWKTGLPRLANDLPMNDRFMRSFATDEAELHTGLGLPVGSSAGLSDSVLVLLSSDERPIARRFEILPPGERLGVSAPSPLPAIPSSAAEPDVAASIDAPPEPLRPSLAQHHATEITLTIPVYRGRDLAAMVEMEL